MPRSATYDRDETLDAAMCLFWDKGYHATSLKDLEAALNMKPGSIYAAFKSKENLYLLALEKYSETFRTLFKAKIAEATSPLQGLADHLRSYPLLSANDITRKACMLTKTMVDTRTTDAVIADRSRQYLEAMRGEIAAAFTAAKTLGELKSDMSPDRLARRYQANVTALRLELHQETNQAELSDLAEDMAREVEALRA
ncbi:TetR family transcriptional regulator [Amylibacter ulvae]|uniref:TetR family transcriptional regulator n=1 Tax=Paramylibacter ulvae TaxID=1651968 RepID=A0ABQ3D5T9_9RHOB|nr:TetR/AcrR family transcriptional regulator [Amylibacter ulvae]GHA58427.1 TetR family transcriptional regulator [Amylibacter ulvae]